MKLDKNIVKTTFLNTIFFHITLINFIFIFYIMVIRVEGGNALAFLVNNFTVH